MISSSEALESWVPRTSVGRLVKEGKIRSIDDIFKLNLKIKEPEIVDYLLPGLKHEIASVRIVQRQTEHGEVSQLQVLVAVGNENGYVGVGVGKARQINVAIEKAIRNAKLNIAPVRRGCGSWHCSCSEPHSVPFKVEGKCGSVRVRLIPAPKGVGLVAADPIKIVLRLAGIKDVWTWTKGETRTTINFVKACFDALLSTYRMSLK